MGILDFVKHGAQELFIARPEAAKTLLVYKHPDPTIPNKADITVMADEVAVFYRDGVFVGNLGPGKHPVTSQNIPFLDQLVDQLTGGNTFRAELWFVSLREMAGLKFGGRIGAVEDPKSGIPVETKVFGSYSAQIVDPQKAIAFFGLRQSPTEDDFEGWFRENLLKVVRDRVAELLVKQHWPLLDITSGAYTEELEQAVIEGTGKHLDRYGVKVVAIGNLNVEIGDEDAARLKKLYDDASYIRMAGGMQGYQQFAAAKAMLGAGEGMAKGGGGDGGGGNPMLAGAGMALGMGMANLMGQHPSAPAGAIPQAAQSGQAGQAAQAVCGACGRTVAAGKFCAECGKELAPPAPKALGGPKSFCSGCGGALAPGARFCGGCGAAVS